MLEYQWHFFKCLTIQHAAIRYLDFFIVNALGIILFRMYRMRPCTIYNHDFELKLPIYKPSTLNFWQEFCCGSISRRSFTICLFVKDNFGID